MNNKNLLKIMTVLLLGVFLTSATGCEALRKKFTRKKKKTSVNEGPLPILEPIDYGRSEFAGVDAYKKAYSLWKVWTKEFYFVMNRETNDKNLRYLLSQMITQLTKMKDVLVEDKAQELGLIIDEYNEILETYNQPAAMRRLSVLKNQYRQIEKAVRHEFNPDEIGDYLK